MKITFLKCHYLVQTVCYMLSVNLKWSQMQNIFKRKRNTLLYISKINTDTQEKTQVLCALPRMQKALAMDFTAFSIWFILSLKYFVKELPC